MSAQFLSPHSQDSSLNHPLNLLPHPEIALAGDSSYRMLEGQVELTLGQVNNHRDTLNISGSLQVSLVGRCGDQTHIFASVELAPIWGQYCVTQLTQIAPLSLPASGTWALSLVLSEWGANGYEACDQVLFAVPYCVQPTEKTAVYEQADSKVISVDFGQGLPSEADVASDLPLQSDVEPSLLAVELASDETVEEVVEEVEVVTKAAKETPAEAASEKMVETAADESLISINHASAKQLTEIKGVSARVAKLIVDHRPYDSLEGLLVIKGIGAKMLAKWNAFIRL
ncbi:MAG: ComEA family DNA-binding protein [Pontibacterium sp.]